MEQQLVRNLQEIGLNEKESRVYLSALSLGPSTPLRLASTSGVKRATVYNILESLKAKGLVSIRLENQKRKYVAETPARLEALLETKKSLVTEMLPRLNALHKLDADGSSIRYFEGMKAARSVYNSLLNEVRPGDDYLIISHQPGWYNLDPKFFESFLERRGKLPIHIRMLTTKTPLAVSQIRDARFRMKAKLLPKTSSLSTNLVIIPGKVVIQQIVNPVVVLVVENTSIVQLHRELFEIIWAGIPER